MITPAIQRAAHFHRIFTRDEIQSCLDIAACECAADPSLNFEQQALRSLHASSNRSDVRSISLDTFPEDSIDPDSEDCARSELEYEAMILMGDGDDISLDELFELARIAAEDARLPRRARNFFKRLADEKVNDHDTGRWLPRVAELRAMIAEVAI